MSFCNLIKYETIFNKGFLNINNLKNVLNEVKNFNEITSFPSIYNWSILIVLILLERYFKSDLKLANYYFIIAKKLFDNYIS